MTNSATSNDAVNSFPVCYFSVVTTHSSFSPANEKLSRSGPWGRDRL